MYLYTHINKIMYEFVDIPPEGLIQTSGYGDTLISLHHQVTGWPLYYPDPPSELWLQDDLTHVDGTIVELENYIKHYGEDISQITFLTEHQYLIEEYPQLTLQWYPRFHWEHWKDACDNNMDKQFNFTDKTDFVFLCLNMNRRKHRDQTVKLLQNFPNRLMSYRSIGWDITTHPEDWSKQDYNSINLNQTDIMMRLGHRNTQNLIQLQKVYESCQFSVVTETRYELPYDFITEKTTQCWLALHPALYVSNKGHVQILRDWGFDVFDDVFDHSYDILDNDVRLNTLVESNREVLTNGILNFSSLKDRLLKNRDHYLNNWLFS